MAKKVKEIAKQTKKFRIKKGDKVKVITGKDKGKEGEVLRILREKNRVIVAGINLVKKHQKPGVQGNGGIVEKELSLHISNVAAIDPKSGKATKVGYKTLNDGTKVRFAKKSGENL